VSLVYALMLLAVLAVCWVAQALGLPGNWLIVLATALYVYVVPAHSAAAIRWPVLLGLAVLAALGEVVELTAGALGAAQQGGSRRGALLALVGSVIGSLVGVFVGLPIPVIGSIVAAVLFGGAGALVGAILGEAGRGRTPAQSWAIGIAAFRGRFLGTLFKLLLGAVMVLVVLLALLIK
jgi:hypothetical protein